MLLWSSRARVEEMVGEGRGHDHRLNLGTEMMWSAHNANSCILFRPLWVAAVCGAAAGVCRSQSRAESCRARPPARKQQPPRPRPLTKHASMALVQTALTPLAIPTRTRSAGMIVYPTTPLSVFPPPPPPVFLPTQMHNRMGAGVGLTLQIDSPFKPPAGPWSPKGHIQPHRSHLPRRRNPKPCFQNFHATAETAAQKPKPKPTPPNPPPSRASSPPQMPAPQAPPPPPAAPAPPAAQAQA